MMPSIFDKVTMIGEWSKDIKAIGWVYPDESGFCRDFEFEVRGQKYRINAWTNYSYLFCGEMFVIFDDVEFSGTWPNHFNNNLVFTRRGNIVALIPVEEYGGAKENE